MLDDTCLIPLGKRSTHYARVDQRFFAAVAKWRWNWKVSSWKYGRKVYGRRGGGTSRNGATRPTVYMHEFILTVLIGKPRPSPLHTVHHKDGDSLNNTSANLCWATRTVQSVEQKPRICKQGREIMDEARMAA